MKSTPLNGIICVLTLVLSSICTAFGAAAEPANVSFVALGDTTYGPPKRVFPRYERLIAKVNKSDPQLVVHVGDLHGLRTCDNALLKQLLNYLNSFDAPVLYTPGDNEWTDCAQTYIGGKFDPLERLDHIRRTYFTDPDRTLGAKPVARGSQAAAGYPENSRLKLRDVGFITLHVVGSNNNYHQRNIVKMTEFTERNAADLTWINESFDKFSTAEAIVVALHADMFVRSSGFRGGWRETSPYRDIGVALGELSSSFKKPVLLLYGDSHEHKVFQPFPKQWPYLHAIQVYGHPDIAAVEITVVPDAIQPFQVTRSFWP